jgi:hypothetical protein
MRLLHRWRSFLVSNLPDTITDSKVYKTNYIYDTELNKLARLPSSTKEAVGMAKETTSFDSYNPQNGRLNLSYMNGIISMVNNYTNGLLSSIAHALSGITQNTKV